jgi:hypothetical protein
LHGLLTFAPAFAEEDGGAGVAVENGFDVHGSHDTSPIHAVKENITTYMGTYRTSFFA